MPQIDRFCARCRSQISEKRVVRGSCFCSDECRRRTRLKGAERELRNTADFATEDSRAKRRPRPPDRLLPHRIHEPAAHQAALLDERASDARDALRRPRGWVVGGRPRLQKAESHVTLKLPWDGDTVGQELGSVVGSNWGDRRPLCPTQSSK